MTKHNQNESSTNPGRRDLLKTVLLGGAGVVGAASLINCEEKILLAQLKETDDNAKSADTISGATPKFTNWAKLEQLKKKPPLVKISDDFKISRMVLGGNLFAGWAHSRDLIYVSELIRAYNTPEKLLATFQLADACGINAFLSHFSHYKFIEKYWDRGGTMHFIADCRSPEETQISIDQGASACYINGEKTDEHVQNGRFDILEAHLKQVRDLGLTAGLGAHRLTTVKQVHERGIRPDFWMKSYHHTDYWSAKHPQEYDNIFCRDPKGTAEFMQEIDIPWIAFKVLAAGAIHPKVGFRYAYEGGADAICVGMYDFQLVDNINTMIDVLDDRNAWNRTRRWLT